MNKNLGYFIVAALWCVTCSTAFGSTLAVSTSGSFSSADIADAFVSPGADWQLTFTIKNQPAVSNAAADGFDIGFSNFSYVLNGMAVSDSPASIRFYASTNNGLFTVFFGPESGVDSSGNFIPEFNFSGAQLFSGLTSNPSITSGINPTSEVLFTDANNYDDQVQPGRVVAITSLPTPEPSSGLLFLLGGCLSAFAICSRRIG